MVKGISDLITMCHNIVGLVGWVGDCLRSETFASCVDANDCVTGDMCESKETFACTREIVSFSNEHSLGKVSIIQLLTSMQEL
jgi:hypothetical protein